MTTSAVTRTTDRTDAGGDAHGASPSPLEEEAAVAAALTVSACGLAGSQVDPPATPLAPPAWQRLAAIAGRQGLVGLLDDALRQGMPATREQRLEAAELRMQAQTAAEHADHLLTAVVDALDAHDVGHRVLDGLALARLDYPLVRLRPYVDVNLLVPADRLHSTAELLVRRGFGRRRPELFAGFDERFAKGVTLLADADRRVVLHRTLAHGPFGHAVRLPDLFGDAVPVEVAGREVAAPDQEIRFLTACYRAVLDSHPAWLLALRDVAQILLTQPIDAARVTSMADAWRGCLVVAEAITRTWDAFRLADAVPLSAWARTYVADRWQERAMTADVRRNRRWAVRALASVPAIGGVDAKAAYLRGVVVPSRTYLSAIGESRLSWMRRGVAGLTGGRP